jgi:hypothetical protein
VAAGRRGRFGLGRQLIGWIAAYAFVLHAVFAGMVATKLAAGKGAAGFELCITHPDGTPAPIRDGVPAPAQSQHQHDQCALHCAAVTGLAALALALIALVFPLRPVGYVPVRRSYRAPSSFCRAGLSRAPPLPA